MLMTVTSFPGSFVGGVLVALIEKKDLGRLGTSKWWASKWWA